MTEHIHKPWDVLDRREIYAAPPWIRVSVERVRLPDGRVVDDYHRVQMPDYALVAARGEDGRFILIRQYKHGIGRAGLFPPGGHVASGEEALEAIRRELLEETGCVAEDWRPLGSFTCNSNQGCGHAHFFSAIRARQVQEPRSGDLEDMEIVRLDPAAVADALRNGEVPSLGAAAALSLALNALL